MKNFSISVCYFHLNQTLAEPLDRVSPKADLIWENLIKLSEKLPFTELKDFKSKLACYELDEESNVFKHKTEALNLINQWLTKEQKPIELAAIDQNGLAINGKLQPFLLHDTYAFDLSLLTENYDQDITPQELCLFEPSSLLLDCSENTLGETIWFYGETEVGDTECQTVADKLVTSFMENTEFTAKLVAQGSLLKVLLFEYEISPRNQPDRRYKILVWVNNRSIDLDSEIDQVYNYLFGSLGTRHKIEYVYQQAQENYSEARKAYSDIEAKIKEFKQDKPLEELQKLLESMPELSMQYQRQLRNLQWHYTTIKTNQLNYQTYLQKFWQPGDIPSWREFGENTCKRYLDQIEIYLSYIQPGKDLIGEFINTLRGLVEIEQAKSDRQLQQTLQDNEKEEKKRDRNLQITIAVVGVGIGVAGVVSSSYTLAVDKPWAAPSFQHPLPLHPFFSAIIVSCICGGGLGAIAWWIAPKLFKRSDDRTSLPSSENQPRSIDV